MNTPQSQAPSPVPIVEDIGAANLLAEEALKAGDVRWQERRRAKGQSALLYKLLYKWINFLEQPIDASSLAVFRICFGAVMLVYCWQLSPFVAYFYQDPKLHFPIIEGLNPLPGPGMQIVLAAMSFSAACVMLGMRYRVAAIALFISYTYTFCLEKAYYQNHYYFMALLSFLFCFIPANRVWSVDNGMKSAVAPRWSLLLLRAQIVVVYFFGGIAELNGDWLIRQEPLHSYMHTQFQNTPFLAIVTQPWFNNLIAWGGATFDLMIGFILWFPPTFWLGAAAAMAFHLMNAVFFSIGVFPWLMLATIPLFARPDWPKRLLAKLPFLAKVNETSYAAWARQSRLGHSIGESDQEAAGKEDLSAKTDKQAAAPPVAGKTGILIIALMHVYLALQIAIPLRHFFYANNNESWSEHGHLFSWHMMLRHKAVKYFQVKATNPTLHSQINIDRYRADLNEKQVKVMETSPDMILRYAHYVADDFEKTAGVRPIINVIAIESLNGRPYQLLLNPTVDLASVENINRPDCIFPLGDAQAIRQAVTGR